jgi:hypothetical protein
MNNLYWSQEQLLLISSLTCDNTAKLPNLEFDDLFTLNIRLYATKSQYLKCQGEMYYELVGGIFLILFFLNQLILFNLGNA